MIKRGMYLVCDILLVEVLDIVGIVAVAESSVVVVHRKVKV
jgi:hypothetical protein